MVATTDRLLVPFGEGRSKLGGLGRTKFYELIDKGEITRVSIGRRAFVTLESLERYVQSLIQAAEEADDRPQGSDETLRHPKRYVPKGKRKETAAQKRRHESARSVKRPFDESQRD